MQQLYFVKKETLQWREVKEPVIENAFQALVRPFAVAKCDLDNGFLFNNFPLSLKIGSLLGKIDPDFFTTFGKNCFKGPFPFGHECVAEVIETGDKVTKIKIGDVVSVPFQISCGKCLHCSSGITSACTNTPKFSTYGFGKHLQFGGAMSDLLNVPFADEMLLKIPENINPIHLASLSDNVPDAYRNVGYELEKNTDKSILVIGGNAQSVGLYTLLIAKSMAATRVDYVDISEERLAIAKKIGADNIFQSFHSIKDKYDIVVEASSTEKGLKTAIDKTKPYGICSSSGIYFKKTTMPLMKMYSNGITFKTGLANARTDAEKVLALIKQNKLNLELVTTKLDNWDNATNAFLSKTSKVIGTRERKIKTLQP
jgi:threonine dehydrogenase-like Zn-dependent dehydrogenase